MNNVTITKKNICNVDYTHFLAFHDGACSRLHGHTSWNIGIEITGGLNEEGMVIDYSLLKQIVVEASKKIDHKLLVYKKYIVMTEVPPFEIKDLDRMDEDELVSRIKGFSIPTTVMLNQRNITSLIQQELRRDILAYYNSIYKIHLQYNNTFIKIPRSHVFIMDSEPTLENICTVMAKCIANKLEEHIDNFTMCLIMSEGNNNECRVKIGKNYTIKLDSEDMFYDIKNMPEGLTLHKSLDASFQDITYLPSNLTIGDNLIINNTNIKSLPSNLKVKGSILISKNMESTFEKYKDTYDIKVV